MQDQTSAVTPSPKILSDFGEAGQPAASRAITRFQRDGVVENVKYGLYRKLVDELP